MSSGNHKPNSESKMPVQKSKPVVKLDSHVFVCTNEREPGHPRGSCKARGSEEILKALKLRAIDMGLGARVRIQKSGCLDTCEEGPCAVVYPDNVWYGKISTENLDDVRAIVDDHLLRGCPVERLRIEGK